MELIYKACGIWGVLGNPGYPRAADDFDDLATPGVLAVAVEGGAFSDEAYTTKNLRIAKIRERGDRRNRTNRLEIHLGRSELTNSQISYGVYKESKLPAPYTV